MWKNILCELLNHKNYLKKRICQIYKQIRSRRKRDPKYTEFQKERNNQQQTDEKIKILTFTILSILTVY
jgi:hypothetical protein